MMCIKTVVLLYFKENGQRGKGSVVRDTGLLGKAPYNIIGIETRESYRNVTGHCRN